MLIVLPASLRVVVSMTLNRLCVLTSNRNGPFGDAPVFGTNANLPRMAILFNWFGYAPVTNLKSAATGVAGGAILPIASPSALKPVSAIGLMTMSPITVSVAAEIAVTWPAFASSVPSVLPSIGSERNCVTNTVSWVSSAAAVLVMAMPRGSGPTLLMVFTE